MYPPKKDGFDGVKKRKHAPRREGIVMHGSWFKLEVARKQVVMRRKGETRLWDEKTLRRGDGWIVANDGGKMEMIMIDRC